MSLRKPLSDKLFFKIGEVVAIVGVKAPVLRAWEGEFQVLRPLKTRGAHRVYRRRDVELAMLIRRLLHDEGFTMAGARKRLRELGHARDESGEGRGAAREVLLRAELIALREEFATLLGQLDAIVAPPAPGEVPTRVVVHGATPRAAHPASRSSAIPGVSSAATVVPAPHPASSTRRGPTQG